MSIGIEMVSRCQRGSLPLFPDKLRADAHADTLREMALGEARHIDLDLLHRYIDLQFLAVYLKEEISGAKAYEEEREIYHAAQKILADRKETLFLVKEQDDMQGIGEGRTAVLLAMENCAAFDSSIARIDEFYEAGYRSFGLTWNHANCIGGGVAEPKVPLTAFGRDAVRKLGRMAALIDLAHLGETAFYQVLELAERPPIYTHGCCAGVFSHRRNLNDEQMKALADAGGLFGLTFCRHFIKEENATIDDLMDHLVYAAERIGVSALCFGSDFDGTDLPDGITGPEDWVKIEEAMAKRGFAPHEVAAITGGNLLRFVSEALVKVGG